MPKRLLLALCVGAKEAVAAGEPDFKLSMITAMAPKQYDDRRPDDLVDVDVQLIRTLLDPIEKSGLVGVSVDYVPGLLGWMRVFLPPGGMIKIRTNFVLSFVAKIRETIPDPDQMLQMTLDFVPGFLSKGEFSNMDVGCLKDFVGFL